MAASTDKETRNMAGTFTAIGAGKTRTTVAFLVMYAVALTVIVVNLLDIASLQEMGSSRLDIEALTSMESRKSLLRWLSGAAFAGAAVTFLHWLYTANRNMAAIGHREQRFTPLEAVGWWFCPIICLYQPFQVVKEVWERSQAPDAGEDESTNDTPKLSALIATWWTFWIAGFWITLAFHLYPKGKVSTINDAINTVITQTVIESVLIGCALIAGLMTLYIVREVSDNQERNHSAVKDRQSTAGSSQGITTDD